MENLLIVQMSVSEMRQMFQEVVENYFQNKVQGSANRCDEDEIGGIELAVKITGCAKPTIYSLVSKRKIPHSKQGKKLYFSRRDLLNWIEEGKRRTGAEILSHHFSS